MILSILVSLPEYILPYIHVYSQVILDGTIHGINISIEDRGELSWWWLSLPWLVLIWGLFQNRPELWVDITLSFIVCNKGENEGLRRGDRFFQALLSTNDTSNWFLNAVYPDDHPIVKKADASHMLSGVRRNVLIKSSRHWDISTYNYMLRYAGFSMIPWHPALPRHLHPLLLHRPTTTVFPAPDARTWTLLYYNPFFKLKVTTDNGRRILTPSDIQLNTSGIKVINIVSHHSEDLYKTSYTI